MAIAPLSSVVQSMVNLILDDVVNFIDIEAVWIERRQTKQFRLQMDAQIYLEKFMATVLHTVAASQAKFQVFIGSSII